MSGLLLNRRTSLVPGLGSAIVCMLWLPACTAVSSPGDAGPTVAAESVGATAAAQDTVVWQDELDRLADRLGLDRAYPVPLFREVTPAESREALLACLGERGWVADATGGISIAPGQEDSYATATYECTAANPVQERYLQPLAPQAWVLIYDHFTSVAVPCLEDEGLPVPELPSREVFLADPETHWAEAAPQRANLNAAIAATGDDPDEFLARVCPLTPPAESLYPEVPEPD